MPIYKHIAEEEKRGYRFCNEGFEILQDINDKPIKGCPKCGVKVRRVFSEFSLGFSKTGLDRRAKQKGFHKLKKVDKGKYERLC